MVFCRAKNFLLCKKPSGTQVLTTYVKRWEQTDYLTQKQSDAITDKRQKRAARLAAYEEQQAQRQRGDPVDGKRVHWKSLLPSVITATTHVRQQRGSFHASDHGFFGREAAHATAKAGGPMPTVFGLDPGVKNIWNIVKYDEAALDTPGEAIPVLNLGRAEYNHSTKYKAFKAWLEKAGRSPAYVAEYSHDVLTRNSRKVMDLALFEARYREARPAFEVLRGLSCTAAVRSPSAGSCTRGGSSRTKTDWCRRRPRRWRRWRGGETSSWRTATATSPS